MTRDMPQRSAVLNVKSDVASSPAVDNVGSRDAFRLPLGPRLLSLFGAVVVGGLTALMMFMVILAVVFGQWVIGALIVAPFAGSSAILPLSGNDMRGKWRLRVTFEPDQLVLDLPAGDRSSTIQALCKSASHMPTSQRSNPGGRPIARWGWRCCSVATCCGARTEC